MPPEYAAPLAAAGFTRRELAAGTPRGREVYRRPACSGRWVLQAQAEGEGPRHVDVGLTLEVGPGALLGTVHRALSPAALAAALPHVVASLEALAATAESLRCSDCRDFDLMMEDGEGPHLACGHEGKGRRPFDRADRRCRRNLVTAALVVYGETGAEARPQPRSPRA